MSVGKRIFLVAGEHSGDFLGGALMQALAAQLPDKPIWAGVGGDHMQAQGLDSLFPLEDVAVMGIVSVLPRLPVIFKRVYQTVDAAIEFEPDVVVVIDSPEFSHAIARRIKKRAQEIPIINYVSPSVWAWRPGRAKKMRAYVDHIMALLPFEPEVHKRLGGPVCSYVGHPLIEKLDYMKGCDGEALRHSLNIADDAKVLVVLPGSRSNEVRPLMKPFGETVELLAKQFGGVQVIIPVVPSVEALVMEHLQDWPCKPHLLHGEQQKFAAFNLADAALAASGTVTLELALLKTPMVVAYLVRGVEKGLRSFVKTPSIVLANLVLGENLFPEFIQENCTAENLAREVGDLLRPGDALERQQKGLMHVEDRISLPGVTPAEAAANIVISCLDDAKRRD